ncbi:xylose isomerase [Candidatus Pantoea edessiphila]|uniref:Xylose isomerase n=1 Tax=Candidatus Pantoea edessiphila TaxID=2044610 RepID=A0A2P5SXL5_9GAMM|nr:sugar phosphate isomerase/epimerase family protein [Candidatus Pantoea edessiphila]MBK4775874.1 sugar phosphate isomerase/epimerase [Pantoea sp. Edef]PPI87042.1 xylose isomerase [Candidatus Pantoea edessiphila]
MKKRNMKFLNLVLLGGETEKKLQAAHKAGFDQVEIWRKDIQNNSYGISSIMKVAIQKGIGFTNLQVLRDFAGIPNGQHKQKREELRQFIQLAQSIGCDAIQAPASTREDCLVDKIDKDLLWMASEAIRYKMKIMYEPMSWSTVDNTLPLAWERIKRLDQPNIGLVVDLFHIYASGGNAFQLDGIPEDRIYEVQLCDIASKPPKDKNSLINLARHERQLPGKGIIEIESFIDKLKSIEYQGPIGIEVFNDQLKCLPPYEVAKQAWSALNYYWP